MRFYQGLLPAVQWDKEKGASRCEFKNGVLDTDDEELINFLLDEGYLVQEDVDILERGGNLDHGGFEPQIPVDKDLPSGRPPMDNPELAQGPTGGNVGGSRAPLTDRLPESEQAELNQNVVDAAPVQKRTRTPEPVEATTADDPAKPKRQLKRGSKKK